MKILKAKELVKSRLRRCFEDDFFLWYLIDDVPYLFKDRFEFFVNELLGEDLCKLISLPSAEYSIIKLVGGTYDDKYKVITKDFRIKGKTYFDGDSFSSIIGCHEKTTYFQTLKQFRQFCLSEENFIKFKEKMFKMLVLDFFSVQTDRCHLYNMMFEKSENGYFDLAQVFDFEDSFDIDNKNNTEYSNCIGTIDFVSDELDEFIYDSFNNIGIMKIFIDLNINEFFRQFQKDRGIEFSKDELSEKYEFCEARQEILYRCLRK